MSDANEIHIKITGRPGAGKSMMARHILEMILQRPVPIKGPVFVDDGERVTRVDPTAVRGYAPDERRPPSSDPQPTVLDDPDVKRHLADDYDVGKMMDEISRLTGELAKSDAAMKQLERARVLDRQGFNARDNMLCERIKRAEARIAELEAEDRPALVGQRDAWRDIANRLHDILKNR